MANSPTTLPMFTDKPKSSGPVECLGLTFENDDVRRAYFLDKLRAKLQDPEFRKIEGFPIGTDEDILALSDPPYYTACPNPFLEEFIKHYGKPYDPNVPYNKEPFAADVSEGKSDPIYNAHGYHTKVPHKAVMHYILHYTEPGDVVFDGFCGTGMVGVAARLCDDRAEIQSLKYSVGSNDTVLDNYGQVVSKLGVRHSILSDLSPAATFIAYNYNIPIEPKSFALEATDLLSKVRSKCKWMYETLHTDGKTEGRINYVVWSDVFVCPECANEVVYWDVAVDQKAGKVREEFNCPHCDANLSKRSMERAWSVKSDKAIGQTIKQAKQIPVLINYTVGKSRLEKKPDSLDLNLIAQIDSSDIPYWFPRDRMPEGDESRRNDDTGITHVHHFFTKRNLWVLSALFEYAPRHLRWFATAIAQRASKQHQIAISRIGGEKAHVGGATAGHRRGTLYIPSNQIEYNVIDLLDERIRVIAKGLRSNQSSWQGQICSTSSATQSSIPSSYIDYIFIDPPFGGNIMYSELNYLWESWLRVFTNSVPEAIENKTRRKGLSEYQGLMTQCFETFYRVLKPGRWMTVEFHNSKNSVWTSIQEALQLAGFVIADVRTLDKQLRTHLQRTAAGSVNQDLVISTYKPNGGLEERFRLEAGTEEGVWDFVRTHLRQLPVCVVKEGRVEPVAERMNYLLFDRMVAFHVQRGVTVPLSAPEFYAGLTQRFAERDGMYFLAEQVVEYDKTRARLAGVQQLSLFVSDEASAVQWLRQTLSHKPQTYSDLFPQFVGELRALNKHEKLPELSQLLEQNFIRYDGMGDVPSQIHAYLSTNYKDLRGLSKNNPALRAKAKDRWYVPDPNKAADLEKLREKALLREFDEYRETKQRKLKVFRLEAVRVGFRKAWQDKDYATIIDVAHRIPEDVLQEDPKLLMWYDQALTRTGGDA